MYILLSTVVLNSRDWSEIIYMASRKFCDLKIDLAIGFIRKKPALVRL